MLSLKSLMILMMTKEFKFLKIQIISKILKIRMKKFTISNYDFSILTKFQRWISQVHFRQDQEANLSSAANKDDKM